jgi:hypothetical protein
MFFFIRSIIINSFSSNSTTHIILIQHTEHSLHLDLYAILANLINIPLIVVNKHT